ncbi:MAG: adenylosuccinate lyase family protein [Chloroflexi bacterium]|nr:adenylosuccinate lyase family protein [Chloroflexota bacterium]
MTSRHPWTMLLDTFGDPAMAEVFSEDATVRAWLAVERAIASAQADLGLIPRDAARAIEARIDTLAIPAGALDEGFRHVGYPIVRLLEVVGRDAPAEVGAWLHWGATTQDIMDTGQALQLRAGMDRLEVLVSALGDRLSALATAHRATVMAGRTHGQQAVPTTFGAKVAVWLAELTRQLDRLREARPRACAVELFGAGGTSAAMGPDAGRVRRAVAGILGLTSVEVPWHVARDGIAEASFLAATISGTCVRIAREVADLARSEIDEVREPLTHGRGASSTMPQKANPILSEVVIGMGTIAASQLPAVLAAMQGRHERATGEWQVEWDVVPLLYCLAAGALVATTSVADGLVVNADRMRHNLAQDGGLIMAEALMMALAPAVGRAEAHHLVYDLSARARTEGRDLRDVVTRDLPADLAAQLPSAEVLLDPARYTGEVDAIVGSAVADWEQRRR